MIKTVSYLLKAREAIVSRGTRIAVLTFERLPHYYR